MQDNPRGLSLRQQTPPQREIANRHLWAIFMVALIRALIDGAKRTALIGIYELRVHAGSPGLASSNKTALV
jgi:hypothetical protein